MNLFKKWLLSLFAMASLAFGGAGVSAAPVTQLGFALDGSGSVSTANYNLLRNGLSAAIASLPLDGTVEIVIVTYGSGIGVVTSPTVLSAATLPVIQNAIISHAKAGGGTDTAGAIGRLTALMTGSSNFADPGTTSIINLATDGVPNSQADAVAAAQAAFAAGIDALSIEAIGSGVSSASALNNMAAIAFPGPATILPVNSTDIPNPIGGSWVVPVSNFDALAPILLAKVQAAIVPPPPTGVPEPGSLALVAAALAGLWAFRRRNGKQDRTTDATAFGRSPALAC